jgi:hypothetical protein
MTGCGSMPSRRPRSEILEREIDEWHAADGGIEGGWADSVRVGVMLASAGPCLAQCTSAKGKGVLEICTRDH